ncbi:MULTISPECIES: hypothetical protein [unclassified Synechococcus]|uniref:hypothetical protein n=1 Tax=unclassified Synechococcus TaxID=2626047 RepID=UPI0000699965|nr:MULTISPECIES: hypothetical protein [unclassified Synechococcus]EAQ76809.1 hypothetical protein WH5701_06040 [Synechococcus sp. WH 5701]WFN59042.1 hypothetical protein N4320_15005 [Synechococcus sp. CCFWC 502]
MLWLVLAVLVTLGLSNTLIEPWLTWATPAAGLHGWGWAGLVLVGFMLAGRRT